MVRVSTRSSFSVIIYLLFFKFYHIFFKTVVPDLPFGPAINQPSFGRGQHAGLQPASANAALLLAPDHAAALERLQMLEHRRQTHGKRFRQLADRCRSAS